MLRRLLGRARDVVVREDIARADSIADPQLRIDVWNLVELADRLAARSPADDADEYARHLVRVDVIDVPVPGPDARAGWKGPWAERWTIERRGAASSYIIDFTPADDGGTDYAIRGGIALAKPAGSPRSAIGRRVSGGTPRSRR